MASSVPFLIFFLFSVIGIFIYIYLAIKKARWILAAFFSKICLCVCVYYINLGQKKKKKKKKMV
jgi:hypothetical protein